MSDTPLPTPEFVDSVSRRAKAKLDKALRLLQDVNQLLHDLEDANEDIPFDETRWIDRDVAAPLLVTVGEISDYATGIERKLQ